MTLMMEAKRRNAKSGAAYSEREGALVRMLKNDTPVGKMPGGKKRNGNEREKHSLKLHIRSRNGIRTEDLSGADMIRAGRDEASRVFVPSRYCSRKQFEIFAGEDGYYIRNLGRTNPTVLIRGGSRLRLPEEPTRLMDGDHLKAGDVLFGVSILWNAEKETGKGGAESRKEKEGLSRNDIWNEVDPWG